MYFKKLLASSLTAFFLLTSAASFAQDDNTIFMDEDAFNEALSNAGGSLENLSERFRVASEDALSSNASAPDSVIPIDGGLSFLLAAGLGYGANRLRKQRQNRKSEIQ